MCVLSPLFVAYIFVQPARKWASCLWLLKGQSQPRHLIILYDFKNEISTFFGTPYVFVKKNFRSYRGHPRYWKEFSIVDQHKTDSVYQKKYKTWNLFLLGNQNSRREKPFFFAADFFYAVRLLAMTNIFLGRDPVPINPSPHWDGFMGNFFLDNYYFVVKYFISTWYARQAHKIYHSLTKNLTCF